MQGIQGIQGIKGDKGDTGNDGFSPTVIVKESTPTSYKLTITDKNQTFDTPNLKGANGTGTGDMIMADYDSNSDGVVNDSDKLGGQLPEYYAKKIALSNHTNDYNIHLTTSEKTELHTHSNKTIVITSYSIHYTKLYDEYYNRLYDYLKLFF